MKLAIPKESLPGERRVAAAPETVAKFVARGFEVSVEAGAGAAAGFDDAAYQGAGAAIVADAATLWGEADLVMKVEPPAARADGRHEADLLKEGATLISFVWPKRNPELLDKLSARKVTALAMDTVPRITTAQKLDALSSMANIAGYRAVIEAANSYGSFFSGQITAAGRVHPAKVLVIGAGVAGLAAIAAARGLGGIVRAFDTREAVKDEVKSLGAEFLELDFEESGEGGGGYAKTMSKEFIEAEMALFREQAKEIDVVITTALVPGAKAPMLWDRGMVESMKPGGVVVDLAAHQGGNCELSRPGEVVDHQGVRVIGFTDLTSRMAATASYLYGNNVLHLLEELGGAEGFGIDQQNPIVRGALVAFEGEITWPPPAPPVEAKQAAQPAPAQTAAPKPAAPPAPQRPSRAPWVFAGIGLALAGLWLYLRLGPEGDSAVSPQTTEFIGHLTVFVLACFVGWQVIWNVTAALHTPLMSVTNAISGIIIVGGVLEGARGEEFTPAIVLGLVATLLAMVNIVGGFMVTQRMLRMFRK